jgi:hypothetical protein
MSDIPYSVRESPSVTRYSGFGTNGTVLTSNGSGAAPTWQTPTPPVERYYIQSKTNGFSFTGSGTFSAVNNWAVEVESSNAPGDMGPQYWTCPATGTYRVSGYLSYNVSGLVDIIQQAHVLIQKSDNTANYIGIQQNNGTDEDDVQLTLNFDRMIQFTEGEGFYVTVKVVSSTGAGTFNIQGSFGSSLSIERISLD